MKNNKKQYLSIPELAKLLGLSRVAVFKKVKSGEIPAVRIGRNYAISLRFIDKILGKILSEADKKEIDAAVEKTVQEYGEVLKLLGGD